MSGDRRRAVRPFRSFESPRVALFFPGGWWRVWVAQTRGRTAYGGLPWPSWTGNRSSIWVWVQTQTFLGENCKPGRLEGKVTGLPTVSWEGLLCRVVPSACPRVSSSLEREAGPRLGQGGGTSTSRHLAGRVQCFPRGCGWGVGSRPLLATVAASGLWHMAHHACGMMRFP